MNFIEWLLTEKTLYHGTVVDNLNDIKRFGLVAGWHNDDGPGDFVQHYYGDYAPEDMSQVRQGIFMADKKSLHKAVTAMEFHVAKKMNKDTGDVSDIDIRNHGLIVIIKDEDDYHKPYDPNNYEDENHDMFGIEDGDYAAENESGDLYLRGSKLLKFLQMNGYADFGKNNSEKWKNKLQGNKDSIEMSKYPLLRWANKQN